VSDYEPPLNGSDAVPPPAPPVQTDLSSFPWPPAENDSVIEAFAATWKGASLQPRTFFARMPEQGGLGAAIIYYLIIGILAAGAMLFFRLTVGPLEIDERGLLEQLGFMGNDEPLVDFLLSPITLLVSLFLSAGVTHLMLLLFAGISRPFTTTARVFAYAYSPQILGVVPYLGSIVGFIWMVVVAVAGLSAAHRISTGRAAVAVLIPLVLAFVFMAIAFFVAASMLIA
jgi:hypothetical protein